METGEKPQVCRKHHDSPALLSVGQMEFVAEGRRVVCGPAAFQADAREKFRQGTWQRLLQAPRKEKERQP